MATDPIPIHVTTPIPRRRRLGLMIHRSRTFTDEDRALQDGIPVTSVARTGLDLAARVRPRSIDRFLRRAEEEKAFDLPQFESVLARNKGHRGRKPLHRAIVLYRPPRFIRSGLEEHFAGLLEDGGFPPFVTNYFEAGCELDVYWPQLRYAIELDVFETHGSRLSFEEDPLRQEELKLAGIEMTRITGLRIEREPQRVVERVRQLLTMRRADLRSVRSGTRSRIRSSRRPPC
jgi:hypothetical protein